GKGSWTVGCVHRIGIVDGYPAQRPHRRRIGAWRAVRETEPAASLHNDTGFTDRDHPAGPRGPYAFEVARGPARHLVPAPAVVMENRSAPCDREDVAGGIAPEVSNVSA